ncbi:putative ATP-dependent DNA ligase [Aquamicrobium phage P14]|uniref:Putative ATP-dependent DNA ligase n=1 Tax=Aquamicrobium phage P14 TaxID=1927013 RepID=A0A1L5C063_9CAUD|nr:putative ATP-dependent DNA ligase [Aquamicrobium phage P14]APL99489.1 putative ATP-dependent DNA ligase [Aquamicrobium phage P14]
MSGYIVHKAVEFDKVLKARQKELESSLFRLYEAQRKYDGCCAVVIPAERKVYSRTGESVFSMDHVHEHLSEGLVYIGEAWHPNLDFSKISGEFRRKKDYEGNLFLVVTDVLTEDEWRSGQSLVPYDERIQRFKWNKGMLPSVLPVARYMPGSYDAPELLKMLTDYGGYDGLILRDPNGIWIKGSSGNTGEIIKMKRKLSFDLRVTEVITSVGEKTGRDVYSLVVDFKGKPMGVGSGLPHDFTRVPKVGAIVEIEAMDYSSDGLLREPRFKGIRYDKVDVDK